jgi:hypothetical protein
MLKSIIEFREKKSVLKALLLGIKERHSLGSTTHLVSVPFVEGSQDLVSWLSEDCIKSTLSQLYCFLLILEPIGIPGTGAVALS